jgi:3(or 17)beta-hydroxysteroid dehydrogenase
VNSVHPGVYPHERGRIRGAPRARRSRSSDGCPVGHFGGPTDVAYGVLYLVSGESKFVTGPELIIDSGATAAG